MADHHISYALHFQKTQKARRRKLEIQRRSTSLSSTLPISKLETTSQNRAGGGGGGGGFTYGHVSTMGRQRVMEDAVTAAPPGWLNGEYAFFAVYDGHGGVKVAQKCEERMHRCLARIVEEAKEVADEGGVDWKRAMAECFRDVDEEIEAAEEGDRMVGSTAVVVVVTKEEMVVANCGDSRAVLCREGVVVPLSRDHKPDSADERERIEAAGGLVVNWHGWRVSGVLSTSRSLGDHYLRPYVTSEPEVTITRRSESDEFLIIASDGLFDMVSNDVACKVAKRCLSGRRRRRVVAAEENSASEAAAALAELAIAKGSKDNISVIVVQLN